MEKILTLEEAARYLRVAPVTLYRKVRRGEVPAARLGKSWRFHRDQLEEWIRHPTVRSKAEERPIDPFRHLSSRETQGLLKFIGLLRSHYRSDLRRVILYGSRARGDLKACSDIDLLITVEGNGEAVQKIKKGISEFGRDFGLQEDLPLQTLVLSEEEWSRPSFRTFLLVEKVRREGIPLHG